MGRRRVARIAWGCAVRRGGTGRPGAALPNAGQHLHSCVDARGSGVTRGVREGARRGACRSRLPIATRASSSPATFIDAEGIRFCLCREGRRAARSASPGLSADGPLLGCRPRQARSGGVLCGRPRLPAQPGRPTTTTAGWRWARTSSLLARRIFSTANDPGGGDSRGMIMSPVVIAYARHGRPNIVPRPPTARPRRPMPPGPALPSPAHATSSTWMARVISRNSKNPSKSRTLY